MKRLWRAEGPLAVPDEQKAIRSAPQHIRSDSGPGLVSKGVKRMCAESGTGTLHIGPGAPWPNGIVESLNGRPRDEMLSSELFEAVAEMRHLVGHWRPHSNHRRPQRALGKRTPAAFAAAGKSCALRLQARIGPLAPALGTDRVTRPRLGRNLRNPIPAVRAVTVTEHDLA